MVSIRLERYTALILRTGDDPPDLTDEERLRLQDAHLSHIADLHAAGHVLATGPLIETDPSYRGLVILRTDQATAAQLMADDPIANCRPVTLPAWHRRAQWSTLFVPSTARTNFWNT